MLYSFLGGVTRILIRTINGKIDIQHQDRIPKGNYILIAPHRTWFDPVLLALAAWPQEFGFLAKKELYQNRLFKYILDHTHGIAVDRQHPGPSVIIKPVNILRKTDLSLIIFPSGTRHSQKLKSGAALIAKLAQVPLVPAVYQGPLTFKRLFSRKKIHIAFGRPIYVKANRRLNDRGQKIIEDQMTRSFKQLDDSINPRFHYVDVSNHRQNR